MIDGECIMKFRVVVILLSLMFARCATYYHTFYDVPKSTFYTEGEKSLLEKTARPFNFDYGFEPDLELDFVFPLSQGFSDFKVNEKDLARALDTYDAQTVISYSEKIYLLKRVTMAKMEKYHTDQNWKNYTYIQKYLLPPLAYYSETLEKQALKKDKTYFDVIEKRKRAIDTRIRHEMWRKEFDNIWKNDYNS